MRSCQDSFFHHRARIFKLSRVMKERHSDLRMSFSVRMEGLEPSRGRPRQILSLMRLPFRHIRVVHSNGYDNTLGFRLQDPRFR